MVGLVMGGGKSLPVPVWGVATPRRWIAVRFVLRVADPSARQRGVQRHRAAERQHRLEVRRVGERVVDDLVDEPGHAQERRRDGTGIDRRGPCTRGKGPPRVAEAARPLACGWARSPRSRRWSRARARPTIGRVAGFASGRRRWPVRVPTGGRARSGVRRGGHPNKVLSESPQAGLPAWRP